jgi:aspartyl-tRNA(Asn)/glutamyl-tRNA(Gln) amidotransferase subunit B
MRSKEDAHDYRYFPDPDLLPVTLEDSFIDDMKLTLPELPDERRARFVDDYGLSLYDAGVLVTERETAEYFETVATGRDAKQASNWVTSDLFGRLNKESLSISESPVSAAAFGSLLDLISDDTISGRIAKDVFEEMFTSGRDAAAIVEEKGLKQITDTGALEAIVDGVIARGTTQVEQYKSGNEKIIGWFVGQVMKESQGKANPQTVNALLREKLSG